MQFKKTYECEYSWANWDKVGKKVGMMIQFEGLGPRSGRTEAPVWAPDKWMWLDQNGD